MEEEDDIKYQMKDFCVPTGECILCSEMNFVKLDECKRTRRRQAFICFISRRGKGTGEYKVYKPCNRSKLDEQYLMIHIQLLCFLLVLFSLVFFRRQKMLNASPFDLRSMRNTSNINSSMESNSII